MNFAKEALDIIKEKGHTVTKPRRWVLKIFEESDKPLSAYDIQRVLGKKNHLSAITIYRILEFFLSLKLIHRVYAENGYMRCSYLGKSGCHHFLVCKKCNETKEFTPHDHILQTQKVIKDLSFNVDEHVFELLGICTKCGGIPLSVIKRSKKCERSQLLLEL